MRALAKNLSKDEGSGVSRGKRERDTVDIYGELVASKLRELSRDAQEQAQLAIDTIHRSRRFSTAAISPCAPTRPNSVVNFFLYV